jgi:Icc-related predicted phosphoesterase
VLVILGNDDPRREVESLEELAADGLLEHVHMRSVEVGGCRVYGYACVPPTPYGLKDWERWDVSRHLEPGCLSPEEGFHSVPGNASDVRFGTIAKDLAVLVGDAELDRALVLFHAPPHETSLDRAALDGVIVEHVPLDVHVGSIAIRRFIEERQPLVTLHGHVHESARLSGAWRDRIGRTHVFSAAHDGPELALVRFDLEDPASATRELI